MQFPDSHHLVDVGARTGTALPWSSTGYDPWDSGRAENVLRGSPQAGTCPSCTGTTPPLWHSPEGQGELPPSPERGAVGDPVSCRSTGNTESQEAPALWEAHAAWMADKPPTQTGSELRARPGELIYKVPLVLGTKSNVQDILQQTARAGPSLHYLQKDSNVQTLYSRLLPFSYEGK